jgi:peptidoglycan/xylan/chitin deacetylase (PgdA/CDA1 family)
MFYELRSKVGRLFLSLYLCLSNLSYKIIPSAKILLYHRVNELKNDPYKLAVEQLNFERQISYLSKNYNVIPLSDLYENIRTGNIKKKTLAITFDDGYLDNYTRAYPILKKYKVSASIFISTVLEGGSMKTLTSYPKKMREMITSSLIAIGGHTTNHKKLSNLKEREQKFEIQSNKTFIENIINTEIYHFSYPYGQKIDFTKETMNLVKKSGFRLALTAYPGIVTRYTNCYKLPRYVIKNWDLEVFKQKVGL